MKEETIYIGSDHAGFGLKKALISFLRDEGYKVVDKGAEKLDPGDDYPDYIAPVAREVSAKKGKATGIVIGGSGQGEAIAANRFRYVHAAVYYGGPLSIIKLSREHNDANILSLGARFVSVEEAREAVALWLGTSFSKGERHIRRLEKVEKLTKRILRRS